MKRIWPAGFLFVLASCTPPATLFTDVIFRTVAPEITTAWLELGPGRNARVQEVPEGADRRWWDAHLAPLPEGSVALVGAALVREERAALGLRHRRVHLLFFVPPQDAAGASTITVLRSDAWTAVARAAARPAGGAVLYPKDASSKETQQVRDAWRLAGGGPLTETVWPAADPGQWNKKVLLQWAGPEGDRLVASQTTLLLVAGDPGLARPPHVPGLTWTVRQSGLGEFLWKAAQDRTHFVHFLPLETQDETP